MGAELSALFEPPVDQGNMPLVTTGTLIAFPGPNGQNTVQCDGTVYTNLPILFEGGGYAVGNKLLLLRTAGKPVILGTLVVPT